MSSTTVELCLASNPRLVFGYSSPSNFTIPKLVRGYTYTIVGAVNFNTTPTNPPSNQTLNITNQYLSGSLAISFNSGMKYGAKPFHTYTTTTPMAVLYTTEPLSSLFATPGWNCVLIEETITISADAPLGVQTVTFDGVPPAQVSQQLGSVEVVATEPVIETPFPIMKVMAAATVSAVVIVLVYLVAKKRR